MLHCNVGEGLPTARPYSLVHLLTYCFTVYMTMTMNSASHHDILNFHEKIHSISRYWPRILHSLNDETEFCSAMRRELPFIGLEGIMEGFRPREYTPYGMDEVLSEDASLYNALHHLNHVVGSWAMEDALQSNTEVELMQTLALPVGRTLFSGGYGGPMHGAIWQAMFQAGTIEAVNLWKVVFNLCNFSKVWSDVPPLCVHGSGHGMLLIVVRNELVSLGYSSCTSLPYASGIVNDTALRNAITLCDAQGDDQFVGLCAGGLFDAYWQTLSPFAPATPGLEKLGSELCGSLQKPALAHDCFFFMQSKTVDCLHSTHIFDSNRNACLCMKGDGCEDIATLNLSRSAKESHWAACVVGPRGQSPSWFFEGGFSEGAIMDMCVARLRTLNSSFGKSMQRTLLEKCVRQKLPIPDVDMHNAVDRHAISPHCFE